jgi:hypothetical protein
MVNMIHVVTKSGTRYQLDNLRTRIMREGSDPLRQDGVWLSLLLPPTIAVGAPMYLALEPLAAGAVATIRETTAVVSLETVDDDD